MKSSLINLTQSRTHPRWAAGKGRLGCHRLLFWSLAEPLSPSCHFRLAVTLPPQDEGTASLLAANLRGTEGEPQAGHRARPGDCRQGPGAAGHRAGVRHGAGSSGRGFLNAFLPRLPGSQENPGAHGCHGDSISSVHPTLPGMPGLRTGLSPLRLR